MNKVAAYLAFFVVFAVMGYFREFFFVHLNIIMFEKYYHSVSPVPAGAVMQVFKHFSYTTLYYSKYIFTLLWVLLFFLANLLAVKKLTETPYLSKLLAYVYAAMLALAFLAMAYGYVVNGRLADDEYTLSRWLMGIAQSPIICLILVASEKLYNKSFRS